MLHTAVAASYALLIHWIVALKPSQYFLLHCNCAVLRQEAINNKEGPRGGGGWRWVTREDCQTTQIGSYWLRVTEH